MIRQIATELARRGVTQEQAKRVKKLYEQQNGSADKDANATMQNRNRLPFREVFRLFRLLRAC